MLDSKDRRPTRRAVNAMLLAAASTPLFSGGQLRAEGANAGLRPFRVNIPQATIDHILTRVREARWPDRIDQKDWRYGANWDYMKALTQYWTDKFDWRKAE